MSFTEDFDVACNFFTALHAGVKTLVSEIAAGDHATWDKAGDYLKSRL